MVVANGVTQQEARLLLSNTHTAWIRHHCDVSLHTAYTYKVLGEPQTAIKVTTSLAYQHQPDLLLQSNFPMSSSDGLLFTSFSQSQYCESFTVLFPVSALH